MQYIYCVLVKDGNTTRNINIHICLHLQIRYATITSLNFFSFDPLAKPAVGLPETKKHREEHLKKPVGSIYAYVKKQKNRKSNDEEDGDKQKKARFII